MSLLVGSSLAYVNPGDYATKPQLAGYSGGTYVKTKIASTAGVQTYARSLAALKALGADEGDGLSVIHFIDPAYDDALLAGDTTPDVQAYFANAMLEFAAVRAATGRKQRMLIPPMVYKIGAQVFATTDELVISGKGAKVIAPFDAAIPCLSISANDVTVEGLHTHITGASASHPWHYEVVGQNCTLDGVTMEKDDLSGGYQMFCRYGADGFKLVRSRTMKSNGIFIEATNTLFALNTFEAQTAGGDDCLAFKSIRGVTETSRIIGNSFKNHASCISIGSEIGTPGAPDPTYSHAVRGITAIGNVAETCTRMLMIKPCGVDGVDYRDGTVEDIIFSHNVSKDPTGSKAQQMIQILPGRGARIRKISGENNRQYGRAMTGGTNLYGMHINLRSDAGIGSADVDVNTIDVGLKLIDPYNGAAAGGAAPGSPWAGAVRVEKVDSAHGTASGIVLDVVANGTALAGISVGAGLDDAVDVRRARLTNINSGLSGTQGGIMTNSRMTVGPEITISMLGGFPYRINTGGSITCPQLAEDVWLFDKAAGAAATVFPWAAKRRCQLISIKLGTSNTVVQSDANFTTLLMKNKSGTDVTFAAARTKVTPAGGNDIAVGLTAGLRTAIYDWANLTLDSQRTQALFALGQTLHIDKSETGTGAALNDARLGLFPLPY